jgi:subtilisin family serine protease
LLLALALAPALHARADETRTIQLAPNDPRYARQAWPFQRTSLPAAWELTTGDPEVVVAVLDSGVDASHPDLPALAPGWDFVDDDADPDDEHGHGTAVAGAIAARLGNGVGSAGVCPSCTVMAVKVLGDAGGEASDDDIVAGIRWATDRGADVINISLGGPDYGHALAQAVADAIARGVVVVAAGGNDGTTLPYHPAALPGVIGVAASDHRSRLYGFSNYGRHLDLAAPGCVQTTLVGGRFGEACGTSLAAPFVAGVAGLVRSRQPGLTGAEVERALTASAVPAPGLDVGYGVVDAKRALALADALAPAPRIAGSPQVGRRLAAQSGRDWDGPAPHRLAFQWQSCRAAGPAFRCTDLRGANASELVVARTIVGARLRVRATAVAADGTRTSRVSGVSPVVRG